jgi:hypothetical protein
MKYLAALHAALTAWLFHIAERTYYTDTVIYRNVAVQPLWSRDFWVGGRPPTLPLLIKLVGDDAHVVLAQIILHWAGSLALAYMLATLASTRRVRLGLFAILLALSLSTTPFYWTLAIMSESLSVSLLLLSLAGVLALFRWPRRQPLVLVALAPVAALWVLARDADAYVGVILAVASVLVAALARARRHLPLLGALTSGAVLLAVIELRQADETLRWRWPLVNVLTVRMLPDPEARAWLVAHGMPVNDKVECLSGQFAFACHDDLSGFGGWIEPNLKRLYPRWLLRHPLRSLVAPFRHAGPVFYATQGRRQTRTALEWYFHVDEPRWQTALDVLLFSNLYLGTVELLAGLAILIVAWRRRAIGPSLWPSLALGLAVYPMGFFVWHADASEIPRHSLVTVVVLRIALWSAIFLGWEAIQRARSAAWRASAQAGNTSL